MWDLYLEEVRGLSDQDGDNTVETVLLEIQKTFTKRKNKV